jgi:hypothetical protein
MLSTLSTNLDVGSQLAKEPGREDLILVRDAAGRHPRDEVHSDA